MILFEFLNEREFESHYLHNINFTNGDILVFDIQKNESKKSYFWQLSLNGKTTGKVISLAQGATEIMPVALAA